jgi:hypothetical protein
MSKVPDEVLFPFRERMADWPDFDVAGLSPGRGPSLGRRGFTLLT